MLRVYHYPNCSSCKKALTFLREHGVAFETVDLSECAPSPDELREMIRRQGGYKPLFNTSGRSYREGGFSRKTEGMIEEDAVVALCADGMLVKRPFVLTEEFALLGFKQNQWQGLVRTAS